VISSRLDGFKNALTEGRPRYICFLSKSIMKVSPLRIHAVAASLLMSFGAGHPAFAATETVYPAEDSYIQGGSRSTETAEFPALVVAARSLDGFGSVRKSYLLFDSFTKGEDLREATLELVLSSIVANDGDPRGPIELLLYGVPGGEWSETTITWDSAPFHDRNSISDEETKGLELLARITVDTQSAVEDDVVKTNDPRLAEFLRKHPDRVTFLLTCVAGKKQPGLMFFDSDGTARLERRPRLVLQTK